MQSFPRSRLPQQTPRLSQRFTGSLLVSITLINNLSGASYRNGDDGPDNRSFELRKGICFGCGRRGHIRRNCPEGDRRGPPSRGGDRYERDRHHHRRYDDSRSRSPPRNYEKREREYKRTTGGRRDHSSSPRRDSRSPVGSRRHYRNVSRSPSQH